MNKKICFIVLTILLIISSSINILADGELEDEFFDHNQYAEITQVIPGVDNSLVVGVYGDVYVPVNGVWTKKNFGSNLVNIALNKDNIIFLMTYLETDEKINIEEDIFVSLKERGVLSFKREENEIYLETEKPLIITKEINENEILRIETKKKCLFTNNAEDTCVILPDQIIFNNNDIIYKGINFVGGKISINRNDGSYTSSLATKLLDENTKIIGGDNKNDVQLSYTEFIDINKIIKIEDFNSAINNIQLSKINFNNLREINGFFELKKNDGEIIIASSDPCTIVFKNFEKSLIKICDINKDIIS